jgi:hypothetical protein
MENLKILKKLEKFQSLVGAVKKDGNNPYFKSKYATLNSVLETIGKHLETCGLLVVQNPMVDKLETIIFDVESGESIKSEIPYIQISDMQKLGSAITYARRYALMSMLNLEAEDDDVNGAMPKKTETKIESKKITPEQIAKLEKLDVDFDSLKVYYQIDDVKDLSFEKAEQAINQKSKGKK